MKRLCHVLRFPLTLLRYTLEVAGALLWPKDCDCPGCTGNWPPGGKS